MTQRRHGFKPSQAAKTHNVPTICMSPFEVLSRHNIRVSYMNEFADSQSPNPHARRKLRAYSMKCKRTTICSLRFRKFSKQPKSVLRSSCESKVSIFFIATCTVTHNTVASDKMYIFEGANVVLCNMCRIGAE